MLTASTRPLRYQGAPQCGRAEIISIWCLQTAKIKVTSVAPRCIIMDNDRAESPGIKILFKYKHNTHQLIRTHPMYYYATECAVTHGLMMTLLYSICCIIGFCKLSRVGICTTRPFSVLLRGNSKSQTQPNLKEAP